MEMNYSHINSNTPMGYYYNNSLLFEKEDFSDTEGSGDAVATLSTFEKQTYDALPVRHGGLGALNPTKETSRNRATSKKCTAHLKDTSFKYCIFESDVYTACLEQGRITGKKRKKEEYEHERKGIETFYTEDHCCSEERVEKVMNSLLMVVPHTANNLILNKEEFRDQVLMRYLITLNGLPTICACGKCHTLNHALQCKIGGLIGRRHNKSRDNLGCVATQAISPNAVCNNPRVQPCWDGKKGKIARVAD
eukprot:2028291-Ditylum_brightwellii.AAC.1